MSLQAYDAATTAQTDTSLVVAPGAGKQILVWKVYVTSDTAQKVMFESGNSTEIWAQFVGSNGGEVVPADRQPWFECATNEALTYTTSAAGNTAVSVGYTVVDV